VAALAELTPPLLHGGIPGLLAELAIAVAVGAFFVAVWLRERHARDGEERRDA
jgi:hypothetical protein